MTDWASLQHIYGPAADIPALLVAADAAHSDDAPEWDELWGLLYHQGTVYPASYAAIPILADIAERHAPTGHNMALYLAAAIVASGGPSDPAVVRQQHSDSLRRLRDLAERQLALASGDVDFVYRLEALMAFEDGDVWQRNLANFANGELELECPGCGEPLLLNLDGPPFRLINFFDGSIAPTHVQPVEPGEATVEGRLLALARAHGRFEVAGKLPVLFGRATCPSCTTAFDIPSVLY